MKMSNLLTKMLNARRNQSKAGPSGYVAFALIALSLFGLTSLLLSACATPATFTPTPSSRPDQTLTSTSYPTSQIPASTISPTSNATLTSNLTANLSESSPGLPGSTTLTPLPLSSTPVLPALTLPAVRVTNGPGQPTNPSLLPSATSSCGQTLVLKPGTSENRTIAARPAGARGSPTRSYRLHLPTGYKPNRPQALLLVFHGHGGTASEMETLSGFSSVADQSQPGFIAVYPQGIKDDDGLPMWASVGPAADYNIDDLSFVSDLLDQLQKEFCLNPHRIYATGFSNGGGMSHYLACRMAGRIAAVAPIAGNYFVLPDGGCQPSRAVALLEIHGTADSVIAYNGRPDKDYPGWPLPSIAEYLAGWARLDGCRKGPQTFLETAEVRGEEWSECRDHISVAHYQIKGGGHTYPALIAGRSSQQVIWSFLARYSLS